MTIVPLERLLTVDEWMSLEDPPNGRYEILDGELVVSPSASSRHNRLAEDLADLLRVALRHAGIEATVTIDVEWRVVLGERVREAPRPDVAVGWVDPATQRLGGPPPLLVVEVWDAETERYFVRAKRRYWLSKGARWLWELTVGDDAGAVGLEVWKLQEDSDRPVIDVRGEEQFSTEEPFSVAFQPADVFGWSERLAAQLEEQTARLDEQTARLDEQTARLDEQTARAERLAERLRALGVDPDDPSPGH